MISKLVTELGSEVKLTPPDEVQSFHVQHLPHPHSGFSNSSMVTRSFDNRHQNQINQSKSTDFPQERFFWVVSIKPKFPGISG